MMMNAVVSHCAKISPLTVMARLALQRALDPAWVDALFERERGAQYQRELLFSTTVELMSVVAVGLRPSLHAAAQAYPDLPVSVRIPPKLDTCSAANWTVVPSQTGHPFQAKLDTLDATARG